MISLLLVVNFNLVSIIVEITSTTITYILYQYFIDLDFIEEDDVPINQKTILPKSVTGSRRHLRSLSLDALTTVSEYGAPTFFITLTCNIKWREIQERLLFGQDAFDRPDIVVQVIVIYFMLLIYY